MYSGGCFRVGLLTWWGLVSDLADNEPDASQFRGERFDQFRVPTPQGDPGMAQILYFKHAILRIVSYFHS